MKGNFLDTSFVHFRNLHRSGLIAHDPKRKKLILVAQKQEGRNFQDNWLIAYILLIMSSFQAESTASTKKLHLLHY